MELRSRLFLILLFSLLSCGDEELDNGVDQNPGILSRFPVDGQTDIPVDTTFHIVFDTPIDPGTISPLSFVLLHDREVVPATLTYNNSESTLNMTASENLLYNSTYTLSVPSLITDELGNTVQSTSWSFTTEVHVEIDAMETPPPTGNPGSMTDLMENDMAEEEMQETEIELSATRYKATFHAIWSADTHPTEFPSSPHFSGLIGLTHDETTSLYKVGELASTGIKDMAELGSKTSLLEEIDLLIQSGSGQTIISGGGIGSSPGEVSVEFDIQPSHSYVTITSMLAPSPDWFIAISGVNLIENGQWIEAISLELGIYDAGTDSGITFNSENAVTTPAENISIITTPPLADGGLVASLGTIKIIRLEDN